MTIFLKYGTKLLGRNGKLLNAVSSIPAPPAGLSYDLVGVGSQTALSATSVYQVSPMYLLDRYTGAQLAYSLIKQRADYAGACVRVRRSSDNAEQDVGFVGRELDTASLLAFCGAGSGFVTTWYDQTTHAVNAIQTTTNLQPLIVNAGALIYDDDAELCISADNDGFYRAVNTVELASWSVYADCSIGVVGNRSGAYSTFCGIAGNGVSVMWHQTSNMPFYDTTYRAIAFRYFGKAILGFTKTGNTGVHYKDGFRHGNNDYRLGKRSDIATTNLKLITNSPIYYTFGGLGWYGGMRSMVIYPVTHTDEQVRIISELIKG